MHTSICLPKSSRRFATLLLIPFMMNTLILNHAPTSRAEELDDIEDLAVLPLEMIHFDAFTDPVLEGVELAGQVQGDDAGGLTVTFTGAINGSTKTDASGCFNFITFGSLSGEVTATITRGSEAATKTIDV